MSYYLMTNPGYMLGTILVGIAMVFSLYCQAKIKSTYAKYRRRPNSRGITGGTGCKGNIRFSWYDTCSGL